MVITPSVVVCNIQCLSGLNGRIAVIFQVLKDYLDLDYLDLIFFIPVFRRESSKETSDI